MTTKRFLHITTYVLLSTTILITAAGCSYLGAAASIIGQDQTKKVPAEYANLSGKQVCVWVWADESLLFDYPAVRIDVANHARHYILQHVKDVKVIDVRTVDKFQRSEYESDTMPVVQIGRKFNADAVLYIHVSNFLTRPTGSPNLFQGRMNTLCSLYDCKGQLPTESTERKLWSGKVDVVYPDRPVGMMDTNDLVVRSALLKLFGEKLAQKFYEYRAPVE